MTARREKGGEAGKGWLGDEKKGGVCCCLVTLLLGEGVNGRVYGAWGGFVADEWVRGDGCCRGATAGQVDSQVSEGRCAAWGWLWVCWEGPRLYV